MYPRLLTTPYFTLHTFGVLLALAFVAALWWLVRGARREGISSDSVISLGLWVIGDAPLGMSLHPV